MYLYKWSKSDFFYVLFLIILIQILFFLYIWAIPSFPKKQVLRRQQREGETIRENQY